MEEIKFHSLNELYARLLPAFNTKVNMFKNMGINIKEIELWNYLKENIWMHNDNLNLYDMVNDIMKLEVKDIIVYLKKQREGKENDNRTNN